MDYSVRDAYQLTVELLCKHIAQQENMISALKKDLVTERIFFENEIRQLKESIHSLQATPRNSQTLIDDLALSVRSHRAYSGALELGIRKILSKEEADRIIKEAHSR